MATHLLREMELLKKSILTLSAAVEESFRKSLAAVRRRDVELAQRVIDGDHEIDELEVEVEEECLKALALYQPVAHDLRFVVGVLKINDELERIGDQAVNIAQRSRQLARLTSVAIPFDFERMGERAVWMLGQSLRALVEADVELARAVWAADAEVDAIHREAQTNIEHALSESSEQVAALLHLLTIARFVERIADQATNIAKDVIYMAEGEIVRHRGKALRAVRAVSDES